MNVSIKQVLNLAPVKIIIGISVCFSLLVVIQNFISKPILYSIFKDKGVADPIIHGISFLVLLLSITYYFVFMIKEKLKSCL